MPTCCIYNSMGLPIARFSTEATGKSGRITVGRSSHCTISLKDYAESFISREHFILDRRLGGWFIIDRSHIGIVKDGVKIKEAQLATGDVIRFGQLFFCYGDKTGPSPYEVCWDSEMTQEEESAALWPGVNTIGASADNYITVRQGDVSRLHGRIKVQGDAITFENVNRNVRTFLNGALISSSPVTLSPGVRLSLGEVPVRLRKGKRADNFPQPFSNTNSFDNNSEELTLEAAIAHQKRMRKKLSFPIFCLVLFSIGFLTFLMIMLYILFY